MLKKKHILTCFVFVTADLGHLLFVKQPFVPTSLAHEM